MYVQNQQTLIDTATIVLATGGPFDGTKIALFTNDFYPTRTNVVGDFTIANFGGLTNQKSITWGAPFLNANLQAEVLAALESWLTTATTGLPVTAYGYVVLNTGATDWILAERFATPVTIDRSGQNLSIIPRLVYDT